jgi:hypothetical protein
VIALEIGTVTQLDRERAIAVTFAEGLTSPETQTRIRMAEPFIYKMPPLGELKILGHEFGSDGANGWIKIRTSQEVDAEVARASVSLEPSRAFTIRNDGDGFALLGAFEPGAAFRLTIKSGLISVLGGKTQHAYEADLVMGNIAPSFGFVSAGGMYMMLGGNKTIELKSINLSQLAVRVSQIFQNNLVFFLDGGRFYDYSYYGDDEGESVVDTEVPVSRGELRKTAFVRYPCDPECRQSRSDHAVQPHPLPQHRLQGILSCRDRQSRRSVAFHSETHFDLRHRSHRESEP